MYKLKSLKIVNIISFKEQNFEFRNGKAMLIVGNNLTDLGQKGNGAGKSSLIESIAIAFTGSSLRDVKSKELINRNSDTGEVELTLFNTQNNAELKIWRKIYANTKSGEYKAWINDKEQSDRYSDANMFNAFVWQTIGISKEDFFSFYLLTNEYTPFLLASDTKKKEIITRFSGADKVDNAFPLIEEDSSKVSLQVIEVEKELIANRAKQEVLAEQLIEEENKISIESKNKFIEKAELELFTLINDPNAINEFVIETFKITHTAANDQVTTFSDKMPLELQPFKDDVEIAELELETFEFSQDFDADLKKIEEEKNGINADIITKKLELPKVKDKFKEEIAAIAKEESDLNESITQAEEELAENEKFESEVNKQLLDSITCPKCSHIFNLKDKSFNPAEAQAKLPEVVALITEYKETIVELKKSLNVDIQAKKEAINQKVIKAGESIKNALGELNKQLVEIDSNETFLKQKYQQEAANKKQKDTDITSAKQKLTNKETELNNQLQVLKNATIKAGNDLKQKEQELINRKQIIANQEAAIEELRSQEIDNATVLKLTADIEALIMLEDKIKDRLELKRKEKESVDAWGLHFKNFKSALANKSIKNIQDYCNLFLSNMGSDLSISIDGYKTLASGKIKESITTSVLRSGFEVGSFGAFSGGEKARMSLATTLGMQELINLSSPTGGLDFLLIDECLDQVDLLGIENIITSLQPIGKTVMIISQHTEINTIKEFTLTIEKKNNISTIL